MYLICCRYFQLVVGIFQLVVSIFQLVVGICLLVVSNCQLLSVISTSGFTWNGMKEAMLVLVDSAE